MGDTQPSEIEQKISWRHDPEESFSDWTIVVTSEPREGNEGIETDGTPTPTSETYHVHRLVVGAGPRKSNYFLRLFKTKGLKEAQASTSHITLERSAANAFPLMLDFMYDISSGDVEASTETAVALKHLANYFDVPSLLGNIDKFIQDDLTLDNMHIYARDGNLFHDDETIQDTMKRVAPEWRNLFASDDEDKSRKKARYMDVLTDKGRSEFLELALLNAGKDIHHVEQELSKCQEDKITKLEQFHLAKGSVISKVNYFGGENSNWVATLLANDQRVKLYYKSEP